MHVLFKNLNVCDSFLLTFVYKFVTSEYLLIYFNGDLPKSNVSISVYVYIPKCVIKLLMN